VPWPWCERFQQRHLVPAHPNQGGRLQNLAVSLLVCVGLVSGSDRPSAVIRSRKCCFAQGYLPATCVICIRFHSPLRYGCVSYVQRTSFLLSCHPAGTGTPVPAQR
jgi:hypothetical protein